MNRHLQTFVPSDVGKQNSGQETGGTTKMGSHQLGRLDGERFRGRNLCKDDDPVDDWSDSRHLVEQHPGIFKEKRCNIFRENQVPEIRPTDTTKNGVQFAIPFDQQLGQS